MAILRFARRLLIVQLITMTFWLTSSASVDTTLASGPRLSESMAFSQQGRLKALPGTLWFGKVAVGQSATLSVTLTNTQTTSVTISDLSQSGPGFSTSGLNLPFSLGAGQSMAMNVSFAPQAGGHADGTITLTSNASNATLVVNLHGAGMAKGILASNPSSLNFGEVQVGTSQTLSETLTNSGGANVTVTQVMTSSAAFSLSGLSLPLTLLPTQSFTFGAVFAPLSSGAVTDSISVISNGSNSSLSISLAGTGLAAGQLAVTPGSLTFGDVLVGSSKSLPATLNASGANVTLTSASTTGADFTLSGLSFPSTIVAGQSLVVTMTFSPQGTGAEAGGSSFVSNASNSPTVEGLTGNGTTPVSHSVALTWNSNGSGIAGFNIYRGGTRGGPYARINTESDPNPSYTDSSVQNGQTYYYVTTAVNVEGVESGYSNEVPASIPPQ